MPIHTLLVANRGEIARRVLRTCRSLGIRGAVVFTDADADLPFVAEADVAVRIGEGAAAVSYLDIGRVVDAARRAGADAVHPGYGFLAENADFAAAVLDAGLTWVGPPPTALRAMGDKAAAKETATAHGVPVLPGSSGEDQDDAALATAAADIGYPVLVKATAGGGGRGMRRVQDAEALPEALASARREAASAFGDDRVILERLVERARHVEVQIFADAHGNVIHLGERECSIQRRHQKIVEEAPSPAVDAELRAALGDAACRIARATGYVGAGTVEFLLEPDGRFWFLEVNARLQVEHPVTEAVTGVDLVAWQIAVAEGRPLPLSQDEVRLDGHAIEVRLTAEDPVRDYLPGTGRAVRLDLPAEDGVRVDAGFRSGDVISPFYDSLVAKIIAWGSDREQATRRLRRALAEAWMPGLPSNLPLLRQILDTSAWAAADLDTGFLTRVGLPVAPPLHVVEGVLAATVAAWAERRSADPLAADVPAGWRLTGPTWQRDRWTSFGTEVEASWRDLGGILEVRVAVGEERAEHTVRVLDAAGGVLRVDVDGLRSRWRVVTGDGRPIADGSVCYAHLGNGVEAMVRLEPRHPAPGAGEQDPGTLTAPTPGTVVRVSVDVGAEVAEGDVLVVIEAMKMEHSVRAGRAGAVTAVLVAAGDTVAEGAVLVRLGD